MNQLGVSFIPCHSVGTIIHMAVDGRYMGHIVISDVVKPNAKPAVQALKSAGIRQTVMLTGDAKKVAENVAASLGIDRVYSELLPGDKVEKVEELLRNKPERDKLAFVGDGINDAPVLSRADIGIAMGAMGSDAAIDIRIDGRRPDADCESDQNFPQMPADCLSKHRLRHRRQAGLPGSRGPGLCEHVACDFADVGVMILAVLNAIRALFVKKL